MSDAEERTVLGMTEADFEEAARRLAEPPPPPCGSKERPHLVAPFGKTGDVRRCVQCGTIGTLP